MSEAQSDEARRDGGAGGDAALLPRGLGRDRLERVRAYIDDQVHRLKRAPFMQVRILRSGEGGGAFTHSAGRPAPPPAPAVAAPDTLLRIYSMTKPIVSAAAMILVERAVLHLDHPVERVSVLLRCAPAPPRPRAPAPPHPRAAGRNSPASPPSPAPPPAPSPARAARRAKYLPCFANMRVHVSAGVTRPAATTMTVQHLLTHSAGLTYSFFPGPVAEMYKAHGIEFLQSDISDVDLPSGAERPGALRAIVEKLAALPLVCDPGAAFHYSFATDVVGCLIETLTGKLLGDFLREEIFEPLGMVDTGFHVPPEKAGRFAACYALQEEEEAGGQGGRFRLTDEPATSAFLVPRRHLTSGGGGLISTLDDYSKFTSMLLGRGKAPLPGGGGPRVLGRKTVEYMMTNHLEPGVLVPAGFLHAFEGVGFGIGGSVTVDPARNALIGSSNQWSWGGAANTYMNVDLEEGLAFVMLTQVTPSFTLCQWRRDLTNLIQACLVDDAPRRTAGRL